MKRLFVALLLVGALTNTSSIFAQASKSTPTRFSLSTGIGLFPTYYKSDENKGFAPLNFKLGYDISKNFSVGLLMGYSSSKSSGDIFGEQGTSYITNKTKVLGLRAEFRKDLGGKVSAYGGSMLGLYNTKVEEFNNATKTVVEREEGQPSPFDPNAKDNKLAYTAFMGASYNVTKRVNLYGEIGFGISIANLGVTVRI